MSESVDVGAQSTRQHHRTPYEPIQEVRFAVVLFGGVSLAVYINGVVQELLRLVRASAPDPSHPEPPLAMLDEGTEAPLVGSEKIYRQLAAYLPHGETGAHKIRTRFVIDVISGSSAGGINGIYLAKALTHNLGIQSLAELWEKEGDLDKLLNDKASYQGLDIAKEEPASLLNSRRMTWKLLEAFQSLHRPKAEKDHALVDELELLTTATDLRGRPVLLRVGDRKVYEQRHRHIFRFRFASGKGSKAQEVDQFADEFDPFLTFAARATSSFPVAFEPATLAEVEQILAKPKFAKYRQRKNSDIWRPLYQDYFDTLADFNKDGDADFRRVSFGDGGILDNKPFSRVVEAISERSGGMPVERKLIYVEPSPEHPEDKAWDPTSPSVLDNFFLSTIKLPGVETIREDLELLEVYQGLVRRAEIARLGQSDDISRSRYEEPERFRIEYEEWKKQDLRSMIDLFGIGYGPYHRLKVAHLMQKMASLLTTCWGWEPGSEIETALHEVMKVWRDRNYQIYRLEDPDPVLARLEVRQHDVRIRVENPDPQKKTENELVGELDLWWVLRRLRHVRERLGEVVVDTATLSDHLLHLFPELEPPEQSFTDDEMARARKKAQELSQSLGDIQREILTALESLGQATDDVFAKEQRPKYLERRLLEILQEAGTPRSKIERQGLAKGLLDDRYEGHLLTLGIEALVAKLKGLAAEIPSGSKRILKYAHAEIQVGPEIWVRPDLLVEKLAAYHYRYFEQYDVAVFPLLYGTGSEGASRIDVVRISPEDASDLYDQRDQGRKKLAGDLLNHFGAFMDSEGRSNDRIWGRLDAAERILEALVTDSEQRRIWRTELQEEILREEWGKQAESAIGNILAAAGPAKQRHDPDEETSEAVEHCEKVDPLAGWVHSLPEKERVHLIHHIQGLLAPRKLVEAFVTSALERQVKEVELITPYLGRMLRVLAKILGRRPLTDTAQGPLDYFRRFLAVSGYLASGIWGLVSKAEGDRQNIAKFFGGLFVFLLANTALSLWGTPPRWIWGVGLLFLFAAMFWASGTRRWLVWVGILGLLMLITLIDLIILGWPFFVEQVNGQLSYFFTWAAS